MDRYGNALRRSAAPLLALPVVCVAPSAAAQTPESSTSSEVRAGASVSDGVGLDAASSSESDAASGTTSGFEWGLRTGLELGLGEIDDGNAFRGADLNGVAEYRIPVWLDLGYRFTEPLWLGLYAQAGSGAFGDSCPSGAQCEWTDVRLGGQLVYNLAPTSPMDPWLGLGLGWEWLRGSVTQAVEVSVAGEQTTVSVMARELRGGPQLLLQGGLGFDLGETVRIGPYVSAAAGMYLTDSFECTPGLDCSTEGEDLENKLHAWLGLGIRGTHGP